MAALRSERSARDGGAILVFRFVMGALLNYAFGVTLTWLLDPAAFGAVAALQNVLLLASGVLTAGFPWALAVKLSDPATSEAQRHREFRTALLGNLVLGGLFATAFLVAQVVGARVVPESSLPLDLTISAEIVILSVNSVLAGALQGTRRFGGLGAMQSIEILVKCVVALSVLAVVRATPEAVALGFVVGSLVATGLAARGLTGVLPGFGAFEQIRSLAMAGAIWVGTASFTFLLTADVLGLSAIGAISGITPQQIAGYQACAILARAGYYLADALMDAVFPYMTATRKSPGDAHRWWLEASRWIPLLVLPAELVLALAPLPLLQLFFPASYTQGHTILRLLAIGTVGLVVTNNAMKGLYAVHQAKRVARLLPLAAVVEIAVAVVLIPRIGATGSAAAYCAATWLGATLLLIAYVTAQRPALPAARTVGRFAAALLPAAGLLAASAAFGTALAWVLITAALIVYLGLARTLRLFGDEDIERVLGPLRALPLIRSRRKAGADVEHAPSV